MIFGGLEAGGTKMVCAIGNENGEVLERISIPTCTPDETFPEMIAYFQEKKIEALGIGSFGPVDLNRNSATYGHITKTPKPGWAGADFVGRMKEALQVPVGFDTDVNAAILGEVTWGAAKGCENAIYITVGTGIGVGVYVNGGLVHGLVHPEGGHILIQKIRKILMAAVVRSIHIAWRVWLPDHPFSEDTEKKRRSLLTCRRYGN